MSYIKSFVLVMALSVLVFVLGAKMLLACRHLPLPRSDAESKQKQEAAIEQLLQEEEIDIIVLARCACLNSRQYI